MIKRGWLGLVICLIFVLISLSFAGALWPFDLRDDKTTGFAVNGVPGDSCKNNSDCSTNLCVSDKCASKSFWNKFVDWVKGMFGVFVYYEENGNNSSTSNLNSPFKIILSSRNKNNAGESNTVVGGGGVGQVNNGGSSSNTVNNITSSNITSTNNNNVLSNENISDLTNYFNFSLINNTVSENTTFLNNTSPSINTPFSNNPPSSNNTNIQITPPKSSAPKGSLENPVVCNMGVCEPFPTYPPSINTSTIITLNGTPPYGEVETYSNPLCQPANRIWHCSEKVSDNVCPVTCAKQDCYNSNPYILDAPVFAPGTTYNDVDCCIAAGGHFAWYLYNWELIKNVLLSVCVLPLDYGNKGNCNASSPCGPKDGCCPHSKASCSTYEDVDCCEMDGLYWTFNPTTRKSACTSGPSPYGYQTSCTVSSTCSYNKSDGCCPYSSSKSCYSGNDIDCCNSLGKYYLYNPIVKGYNNGFYCNPTPSFGGGTNCSVATSACSNKTVNGCCPYSCAYRNDIDCCHAKDPNAKYEFTCSETSCNWNCVLW